MASATETLKEQVGIAKRPITVLDKLEAMKPQIALALPRHLNPDRMIRIALTCLRTNPNLAECDPQSLLASVMLASQLGLEPGVLGQCFLIPYKKTCTLVPGWLGILDLVNRAGKATAWTGAVYANDEFEWALGDSPYVRHRPSGDESTLTHCYAIARVKGSEYPVIEVWPVDKIKKHRDRFNKVGDRHYSYSHFEMYGRKVALLQALKYVPRSVELATAFQLDAAAEMGEQHLEIKDVRSVIEGTAQFTPEQEPQFSDDRGGPAPEKKPENTMCGSCGVTNGHAKDCRYAASTVAQDKQPETQPARDTSEPLASPKPVAHNWKRLYAIAKEKGVPQDEVKMWYTEQYGVESGNELTAEQFKGIEDWLEHFV